MPIHAYAAKEAKATLVPFDYEPKPIGPDDVEVKIAYCGLCHSDIHLLDGEWGNAFPFVPGHEIVGIVSALGVNARQFTLKQKVGIGWQAGSCGVCEYCRHSEEHLCPKQQAVCMGRHGGFADYVRVNKHFVIHLPESLPLDRAAPLLCGGITVYAPLRRYVKPWSRVGVVGIGGLGHLAVKFANAMGCEVTAFTTSKDKVRDAKKLGAHHVVLTTDRQQLAQVAGTQDFILSTVHTNLDWKTYLGLLHPNGVWCQVGAIAEPMPIPPDPLILGQKSVCGSVIGSPNMIREMLQFAALHTISAEVDVLPLKRVNDAIEKVRQNKARYRMVLKVASL